MYNISSLYVNSDWSYSPATAKLSCDLCDLDLWPWPLTWTLPWSVVMTPENFMMIRWWEHSQKGVTDRQTDWRTDRQRDRQKYHSKSCLVAAKTIGHLFYATSSFVHHFVAIGDFKLELQSGNAQFGSNSTIFRAVWPWNLMYDLDKH